MTARGTKNRRNWRRTAVERHPDQRQQSEHEIEVLLHGEAPRVLAWCAEVILQVKQIGAQRTEHFHGFAV
ncbi:MAG: hypothetical protein QM736_05785 [Vicinamibacterales bacterium]